MKKIIATILVFASLFAVGCSNRFGDGEEIDETKTQLRIEYFNGGVGSEWLTKVAERFEAEYADEPFEEGKLGVEIILGPSESTDYTAISKSPYNLFFTENIDYFRYAAQGSFLEISDIVRETTLPGETVTLEQKLSDIHRTSLTALDGNYYAVPHYEFFHSAMYDADLFETYGLFYADDRENGNGGFVKNSSERRSAGPDGIYNTGDDGMPVTYDEFFALCDYMLSAYNITPFVWTGESSGYILKFISALAANYGGAEDWYANYSFGGQAKIISDYDTLEESTVQITPNNGYLLSAQAGKYYALRFLERMLSNSGYYHGDSISRTYSHVEAQEDFIYSKLENEPIAMIIEGSFWENEAAPIFQRSIQDKGDAARNRKFGIMSLPLGTSAVTRKTALLDNSLSYAFINANIKNNPVLVRLAKLFLQYCYTDESLAEFTRTTNMTKAVDWDYLSEDGEDYAALSDFGRQLWDLKSNSDVVYQISDNNLFMNNSNMFEYTERFISTVNGTPYLLPITALRDGISAINYFKGMYVDANTWESNYEEYFE